MNPHLFCQIIRSFYVWAGWAICKTTTSGNHPPFFIYLPYNPVPSVYLPAHWPRSPRAKGVVDPSPLTPSAGQTLTLGQMDNGLYALSPPDHTLLLPALSIASPFTSRCPSSLFLHLACPALDCLNSQILCPLSVRFTITPLPSPALLPSPTALIFFTSLPFLFSFTFF